MSDEPILARIHEARITVEAMSRSLGPLGGPLLQQDLGNLSDLLTTLEEHTAYWNLMRGLQSSTQAASMAGLFLTFMTYVRQDYEKHAEPDAATYRQFCLVIDDLYAAAKDARRLHRGF